MKISIVTPSYNQGKFIAQTFESVLSQDVSDIEYIVMDGGSTDSTKSVVKNYAAKFRKKGISFKFISKKDKGQSDAINNGWRMASGDIITYINSDDYYNKNVLKKVTDYFRANPKTMWAYGGWNFVNQNGKLYQAVQPVIYKKQKLLDYCNIGQPSCFFRKELLNKVGLLNEQLHLTMDYDLWLRFATKYPAGVMDFPISNMRYHLEAKSGSRTMEHLFECFSLNKQYSKTYSWQRLRQIFFFVRGFIVILLKRDLTRRVNSRQYNS